jgi:hypothetical protein
MNLFKQAIVNMNSLGTTLVSTTFGVNVPYFNITKSTF